MKNNPPVASERKANDFRQFCILSLVLSSFFSLAAADPWTKTDSIVELCAVDPALVLDWGQTRSIAKGPGRHYEQNIALGLHPSLASVNRYFIGALVLHPIITYVMPEAWRRSFQAGTVGLEIGCIAHNYKIGIRVNF
jgi:hypothetical protein